MQTVAKASRRTVGYTAWSAGPVVAAALVLWWPLGRPGLLIAGLLALPWIAWRYDNETRTFLPLSVLLLFLFGVLGMLLYLMAIVLK